MRSGHIVSALVPGASGPGSRQIVEENLTNCGENDLRWTSIPYRGSRNTPSRLIDASCYRNRELAPAAMIQLDPKLHFIFFIDFRLVIIKRFYQANASVYSV